MRLKKDKNSIAAYTASRKMRKTVKDEIVLALLNGKLSKIDLINKLNKSHQTITSALAGLRDNGKIDVVDVIKQPNGYNVNVYGVVENEMLSFALRELRRKTRVYNALVTLRNEITFSDKPREMREETFDKNLVDMININRDAIYHLEKYILNLKKEKNE